MCVVAKYIAVYSIIVDWFSVYQPTTGGSGSSWSSASGQAPFTGNGRPVSGLGPLVGNGRGQSVSDRSPLVGSEHSLTANGEVSVLTGTTTTLQQQGEIMLAHSHAAFPAH